MSWIIVTDQLNEAIELLHEVTEMWPAMELHRPHEDRKDLGNRISKFLMRIQ